MRDHDAHGQRARSTALGGDGDFVPCLHSVGMRRSATATEDVPWPCNAENKYIVHFPETREIWSFGSGYGGNALLGKKCFALRIASVMAREEGWLAEHMLILKLTSPEGERQLHRRRLPVGLRQDQPGDADPDAARAGRSRRSATTSPGCASARTAASTRSIPRPASSASRPAPASTTNPNAIETIARNTIFTNSALTDDGDVWWEGMTEDAARAPDRLARRGLDAGAATRRPPTPTPASRSPPRRTRRSRPSGRTPHGVPIDAFLFGGRRSTRRAARVRGLRLGARRLPRRHDGSETTAAATGTVGELRRDPFAMLPFCGYNMGDYFAYWLRSTASARTPSCRGSSTSTGSARTPTAASCGPASARTRACWSGSSAAATATAPRSRRRSACCRRRARRLDIERPRRLDADMAEPAARRRRRLARRAADSIHEHFAKFGEQLPPELDAQLDALADAPEAA